MQRKLMLWLLAAGLILAPLVMLAWQHTITWSGDGYVQLEPSGRRVKAAIDVERRQWLFGAVTKSRFHIQQLDWSDKSYSRLLGCTLAAEKIAVCQGPEGAFRMRVVGVPDMHQFQDDDGVEVTAPSSR